MDALEAQSSAFAGADAVFCTLGSTRAAAGSAAAFRTVDLDYVDKAAAAARAARVPHFSLLTAQGARAGVWHSEWQLFHGRAPSRRVLPRGPTSRADAHSAPRRLLYMHIKGAAEQAVIARRFPQTAVFRPGMLDRGAAARRWAESVAGKLLPSTHVADVARAMIATAERQLQAAGAGAADAPPAPPLFVETADVKRIAAEVRAAQRSAGGAA
jgi:oxidoreductase